MTTEMPTVREDGTLEPSIELAPFNYASAMVYEYGIRPDPECLPHINEQIFKARCLYNDIVAIMRRVYDETQAFVLDRADPDVKRLAEGVDIETEKFKAARAANDEEAREAAAVRRRELRDELKPKMQALRAKYRDELRVIYAPIGTGAECETYQARCRAVAEGLGFATASEVLRRAMTAWKDSMKRGKPPQFARAAEIQQDALTIQFTNAGGISVPALYAGASAELALAAPRRKGERGEFRFRLGAAAAGQYATGGLIHHRELPGAHPAPGEETETYVGMARLLRSSKGVGFTWRLQFVVGMKEPVVDEVPEQRAPLACVHAGWSSDDSGRHVAGLASAPDVSCAKLLQLPKDIEDDIKRSEAIRSERDKVRDAIVPIVKALDPERGPPELREELVAIRRTRAQHVTQRRLYRLSYALSDAGIELDGLTAWRKKDRMRWQAEIGIARRARKRRRLYWLNLARDLVRTYEAIAIEDYDLAAAAEVVNPDTGKRTKFKKKARRGRVVATLSEFKLALAWQCARTATPLILVRGMPTVSSCAYCGKSEVKAISDDQQTLSCPSCGAVSERKRHGAARQYQFVAEHRDALVAEYRDTRALHWIEAQETKRKRREKMAEGRKLAAERRRKRDEEKAVEGEETLETEASPDAAE